MMHIRLISFILPCAGLLLSVDAQAQKAAKDTLLDRTVVVEQEYAPELLDASKINVLPDVEAPTAAKTNIQYLTTPQPASAFGDYQALPPYSLAEKPVRIDRGYIRAGYGSRGNLDARLGYLFRLGEKDRLGLWAAIDGMNGRLRFPDAGRHTQHAYHTTAALDYRHRFQACEMDLAGQWGLDNFSLHPDYALTHQRFASGGVHARVKSTRADKPLHYEAETNWNVFSRRHEWTGVGNEEVATTEHHVRTEAILSSPIDKRQQVGLKLAMHNLLYSRHGSTDHTTWQLNPFYEWNADRWRLHAGVSLDGSIGWGKALQAAPDVSLHYTPAKGYTLFVEAQGGRLLNDYRRLAACSPYARLMPGTRPADTYEQVRLEGGLGASPYPGLHLRLYGGYRNLKDEVYVTRTLVFGQENGDEAYAGLSAEFNYKDVLMLSVKGVYHHWNLCDEALAFRPDAEVEAGLRLQPIRALYVQVDYRYAHPQRSEGEALAHDLSAEASYRVYRQLGVFVRLGNLLNRTYCLTWERPVQGFHLLAGLSYRF